MHVPSVLSASAAAILALAAPAQQRPVTQISSSGFGVHRQPALSPDGLSVVYLGPGNLGMVDASGNNQRIIAASPSLSAAIWAHDSSRVFYADGGQVRSHPRVGSGGATLGTVAGQNVQIWAVDSADQKLYGTRHDAAGGKFHIFELATTGGAQPLDLVTSQDALTGVDIDPSDSFLVWRASAPFPFSPVEYWRSKADGSSAARMGGQQHSASQDPHWLDAGDTFVFASVDTMTSSLQIQRLDRLTGLVEGLSGPPYAHQLASVSANLAWIVFTAVDGIGGNGPAVMPSTGGGLVHLAATRGFVFDGGPSIDAAGTRVVFAARDIRDPTMTTSQLFRVDLDREMRVYPRAAINSLLAFELPAVAAEVGVILLGQQAAGPVTVSGLRYPFFLQGNFAILGIARPNAGGYVATQLFLPGIPALQGLRLHFQGLRWNPTLQQGDCGRHGELFLF